MNYVDDIAQRIRSRVDRAVLPEEEDLDLLFLFYAVLVLAKGAETTPEDVHDAWVAWMTHEGHEHEELRPFRDLPEGTRHEDEPFVEAIISVAHEISVA